MFSLCYRCALLPLKRSFAVYSRVQVGLTTGQVNAYVQTAEAKPVEPTADASFVKVQLKLKNFGPTAAVNVHADMDYQDDSPDLTGEPNSASIRIALFAL